MVNRMFLTFDKLSEKHDVYKVKHWTQKNGFVQFCSLQICRKHVKTEESKAGAKMVNATFTKKQGVFMGCQERMILVVFTIFASDLLFSFHNFATYLQEANLYRSIFSSSERVCSLDFETEKEVQCLKKTR